MDHSYSSYLLTCAKDDRIILWDTNSPEIVSQLLAGTNSNFDVHWHPKLPGACARYSVGEDSVMEWSGGLYVSPTIAGSRHGGVIAGAWAAMLSLRQDGYLEHTRDIMEASKMIQNGVKDIPELYNVRRPVMTIVDFGSNVIDIFEVNDMLSSKGWHLTVAETQQLQQLLEVPVLRGSGNADQSITEYTVEGYNRLVNDEQRYNRPELSQQHMQLFRSLTDEQKCIYANIMDAVDHDRVLVQKSCEEPTVMVGDAALGIAP
ncbi:sphingosine-1-phosphate lyase [Tanacetum coccineum]